MRCGCPHCDAFMVQEEDVANVCVCPNCGYRCNACLGTGTALTREEVLKLRNTEWFKPSFEGASDDEAVRETEPFTASGYPDAPRKF